MSTYDRTARIILATCLLWGTAATPALAQGAPEPTDSQRAGALIRPAIVYLETTYSGFVFDELGGVFNDGSPFEFKASCTGFVVNPSGYIATAGHCVDTGEARTQLLDLAIGSVIDAVVAADPTVTLEAQTEFGRLNYRTEGATPGSPIDRTVQVYTGSGTGSGLQGQVTNAEVIDVQAADKGDVALLKIAGSELPSVQLAPDGDVRQGTPVLSVGFPGSRDAVLDASLEPTFKDGQISSRTARDGIPIYEVSAALLPGMSGGPTVGTDGRVYGVNSFIALEATGAKAEGLSFLATADRLNDMLVRNNVKAELGPLDLTYREGLELHYDGEYSDAIARFDEVIGRAPSHRQAQEFKAEALRLRSQFGDAGIPPLWYGVGGGVLALLILGGVGTMLLVRRRRARPAPAVPTGAYPAGPATYPAPATPPGGQPTWPAPGGGFVAAGQPGPAPTGQWHGPDGARPEAGTTPARPEVVATPARATSPAGAVVEAARAAPPATRPRFCTECGEQHGPAARFCANCGNSFTGQNRSDT